MTGDALAAGCDLGSTSIKAGILDREGRLRGIRSVAAPPLHGDGAVREGDPEAYVEAARRVIDSVAAEVPAGTPLGLATQRSSFTLWERETGRTRIPLVSWQDRRAARWCERRRDLEPEIVRRTGLLLSAHYAGPKLAAMREADAAFGAALDDGRSAWGTLETLLLWRWSEGRLHESDLTVAARTSMVDLRAGDWSPELLRVFDVPRRVLPAVVPTRREPLDLPGGLRLTATLSDQAAATLPLFHPERPGALVNLGTGAFVLRPTQRGDARKPGYLLAPILAGPRGERRFAFEGTINGAGPAVDLFAPGPTELGPVDPCPGGFAVPDRAGLGSPYWRPEIGLRLSAAAERLDPAGKRRVVLESLLFRIRQILEDLAEGTVGPVLVAGGLIRDPAVGPGLAAVLERPVEILVERESGLLGATRLAAGLPPYAASPTRAVRPSPAGAYLPAKYARWRRWLDTVLSS